MQTGTSWEVWTSQGENEQLGGSLADCQSWPTTLFMNSDLLSGSGKPGVSMQLMIQRILPRKTQAYHYSPLWQYYSCFQHEFLPRWCKGIWSCISREKVFWGIRIHRSLNGNENADSGDTVPWWRCIYGDVDWACVLPLWSRFYKEDEITMLPQVMRWL